MRSLPILPWCIREFAEECRRETSLPTRENLDPEQEMQCRVLGGALVGWFREGLSHLLGSRSIFHTDREPPTAVLSTTLPGLVACHQLLELPHPNVVALLGEEFEPWFEQHYGDFWEHSVHHWNQFVSPDPSEQASLATQFPEHPAGGFRIHEVGHQFASLCGSGTSHLWYWDGAELTLLKEGWSHRVM